MATEEGNFTAFNKIPRLKQGYNDYQIGIAGIGKQDEQNPFDEIIADFFE